MFVTNYNKESRDHSLRKMQTSYRLNVKDLNGQDYLAKSEGNQSRLLRAIENLENETNVVEANIKEATV